MRLPEFTAEVSLYKASAKYTGFSTRAGRHDSSSVTAQFVFGGPQSWGGWWWFNQCPAGCHRGADGHCHCYTTFM
jgi:hypothetical protein